MQYFGGVSETDEEFRDDLRAWDDKYSVSDHCHNLCSSRNIWYQDDGFDST